MSELSRFLLLMYKRVKSSSTIEGLMAVLEQRAAAAGAECSLFVKES